MIAGKATSSVTRTISAAKNGITPLKVSRIGTSGESEWMMKTLRPTGGVISPSSTTISDDDPEPDLQLVGVRP